MEQTNMFVFFVNGKRIEDRNVEPAWFLVNYLRQRLHLTGTKVGCNEGGCGACTVMISEWDPITEKIFNKSVNACLFPLLSCHGKSVTTVEGVACINELHPVQQRLSLAHGSQCGFCTPGFVMAMYTLLRNNPTPTQHHVDTALQGNLCRCTGYRPILEAFYSFTKDGTGTVNGCCGLQNGCCKNGVVDDIEECTKTKLSDLNLLPSYDPSKEPNFPPELKTVNYQNQYLVIKGRNVVWHTPQSLEQLLDMKREFPHAKLVFGNTEIGLERRFKGIHYPVLINPRSVQELKEHKLTESGLYIGAGYSLSEMKDILLQVMSNLPEQRCQIFREVTDMIHWFAGNHIRNTASFVGNLATASPISDLNQIWLAAGAIVKLASKNGNRSATVDEHFFHGYRKTAIQDDEVVMGIEIPFTEKNQYLRAYKQAQRREDDIAIANAAFNIKLDPETNRVLKAEFAFGGMAPTTVRAAKTCEGLIGNVWNESFLEKGMDLLLQDLPLTPGVPGGMERYRQTLCLSFFHKFFHDVTSSLKNQRSIDSFVSKIEQPVQMTQIYQDVRDDQALFDPVGRPLMHLSGKKHTTGQALYCDDVRKDEALHLCLVLSTKARADIVSVDASAALKLPGVVAYFDHTHIPGVNLHGSITHDTPVFAENKVTFYGQPIGAIVANKPQRARKAASMIEIEYKTTEPPIVTIEDAIAQDSYLAKPLFLSNEQEEAADWSKCDHVISGAARVGAQEHFYMEPHCCLVNPIEDDQLEIISSSQALSEIHLHVSRVLGVPQNKIVVKAKRLGGGFGGKESAAAIFATATAVAAHRLRQSVRCTVERFEDMTITGTRHAFLSKYKAGFSSQGKLQAYNTNLYANCGHTQDLSLPVLERALTHCDNAYKIPKTSVWGHSCRTNFMSATAFRGFGSPQTMFLTESMIDHVASVVNRPPEQIRELNLYNEDDVTHYGHPLNSCNIRKCWNECMELAQFHKRRQQIDHYNSVNKWNKRGIVVLPTKFGAGFGCKLLGQAGALVHAYLDGSVLVSHAGVEMGQGLHTKISQIAARVLSLDLNRIHIVDTSTDKVPNTTATAASISSQLNGAAVKQACEKLLARLKPYMEKDAKGNWTDWVNAAYADMLSLSATGFGKDEVESPDFVTGRGSANVYKYFVSGVACTEVVVDCLTGDHRVLRTDIVMDVGQSLNPAIDIGQIEGAFTQGYGLFTMEEVKCSPSGVVLTRGPGTYKIPTADDTPRQFNVKLLKDSSNPHAIFSSKGIGEPPLFLGASVSFAIKDAIKSARREIGLEEHFSLDAPATPERIRMAVGDPIALKTPELPGKDSYTPWTVQL